ncbi:hypothetical protein D9M69_734200 [compost metagenome]
MLCVHAQGIDRIGHAIPSRVVHRHGEAHIHQCRKAGYILGAVGLGYLDGGLKGMTGGCQQRRQHCYL